MTPVRAREILEAGKASREYTRLMTATELAELDGYWGKATAQHVLSRAADHDCKRNTGLRCQTDVGRQLLIKDTGIDFAAFTRPSPIRKSCSREAT